MRATMVTRLLASWSSALVVLESALAGAGADGLPASYTDASHLPLDVRGAATGTPARDYSVAVYELAAVPPDRQSPAPWRANLEMAVRQAGEASAQGADLLVLPEYGISSNMRPQTPQSVVAVAAQMPSPDLRAVPCGDHTQHEVVSALSCAARLHGIYIVANYLEKVPCSTATHCSYPEGGVSLFNTNMAFDRNGTLIQSYRKMNLFGLEQKFLQRPEPHLAAIRTDFGVVMGLMTCFDILFEVPGVEMARRGVQHFVFPTDWGDELPSLTALQMHSAWARGLGVTVLSSGYHEVNHGGIGSGIYTAGGVLNYTYDYSSIDGALVTANVTASAAECHPTQSAGAIAAAHEPAREATAAVGSLEDGDRPADPYYPILHYNVSEFAGAELTGHSQKLCHGDFCCHMTVKEPARPGGRHICSQDEGRARDNASAATYRLLAFKGHRYFSPRWSTEICLVVLCADDSQASCSSFPLAPAPPTPPFQLQGTFSDASVVFPSAIRLHMRMTADWQYDRSARHLLVTDTSELLAAQLYGRNYALDLP